MKFEKNKWYFYCSFATEDEKIFDSIFQVNDYDNKIIYYHSWFFYYYLHKQLNIKKDSYFFYNSKKYTEANSDNYRSFIRKIFENKIVE